MSYCDCTLHEVVLELCTIFDLLLYSLQELNGFEVYGVSVDEHGLAYQ